MAPAGARRLRARAGSNAVGLEATLSIDKSQMKAWAAFAETLAANARRLDDADGRNEHPFGELQGRLAALQSMRQAAAVLYSVLDAAQQRKAMHVLPLCCLPRAG
jgi:hypothetical protein